MPTSLAMQDVAPVARPPSRKAIAALVCAVLGVLLDWFWLWVLLTPVTVVLAVLALRNIEREPSLKGRRLAIAAIVISLIVGVLAAAADMYFLLNPPVGTWVP